MNSYFKPIRCEGCKICFPIGPNRQKARARATKAKQEFIHLIVPEILTSTMPARVMGKEAEFSVLPGKAASGDRPFLVSVEGNVGSGKSTMLDFFRGFDDVQLCPEPVPKW